MKILHILDHSVPLFSGYSFRSRSIVRFEQSFGVEPVVLTSPKQGSAGDDVEEIEGIRYYRTAALPGSLMGRCDFFKEAWLMARTARRIAEVVKAEKVDLIHSHSPLLNGFPALWVARRFRLPLVYEARAFWEDAAVNHGTFREQSFRYRMSRALETFLFKKADRVVTICEGMRKDLVCRGVAPEKIQVVPNGVDTEWFQPQPRSPRLVEQLALNGKPVFGFVGSFYRYEGLRFLLDTVPQLVRKLPGAKVLLVGGGSEEMLLREKAKECGDSVIFTGQVPHEHIRDFYSVIDIFVCPRQRIRLTELVTPLKPLEAMGMAKVVLASDVGGHLELIRHDKTGLLFRAGSRDDFLHQAVRAAEDPKLRQTIGEEARRYVKSERAWLHVVPRYLNIYEDLVRSKGEAS